jgi:hypothetical protein
MQGDIGAERDYFMSQDQKDAAIGRVLRNYKETKERLALLQAEAERIGFELSAVGETLRRWPQCLVVAGENYDPELVKPAPTTFDPASLDSTRIQNLIREIRDCYAQLRTIEQQKSAMGF